jgi:hypothetical protein
MLSWRISRREVLARLRLLLSDGSLPELRGCGTPMNGVPLLRTHGDETFE